MSSSIPDLRVHLQTPDEQFRGRCTDLNGGEGGEVLALVEFSGQVPALRVGERAQLNFRGGGLVANIDSEGLTVLRIEERTRRCYCFRLDTVPRDLLLVLANRRNSSRVRPQNTKPVRVRVLSRGGEVLADALVHDISTAGLSILVDQDLEGRLVDHVQIRLAILLPASSSTFEVEATIRNRRLYQSGVLYGLEFHGHGPELVKAQEQILSFFANLPSSTRPRP